MSISGIIVKPLKALKWQEFCCHRTFQMLVLQSLSFLHSKPILSPERTKNQYVNISSSAYIVHGESGKNDSHNKFEIDPDEAKQALQKLDQQLKSFSNKKITSPNIKAADMKITRDQTDGETLEISGSFLTYTAVSLIFFTIFYNVLFYAVIKPSIDGPDDKPAPASTMMVTESPSGAAVKESPPPLPDDSVQR